MMKNKVYIGIFLISIAALALEISLIRFFSISQWYHFAFMVVSIALFGIAASGTFLTIKKLKNPLFSSSILFSISVLIGFFIINNISFDPFKAILDFNHVFVLLLYYIFLGLPFFFFGVIIAYVFSNFQKKAGRIYFWNMSGSAIGAVSSLFFISYLDVKTILIISLIGLVSSLFFIQKNKKLILVSLLIVINLLLFFAPLDINISKYKELSQALNVPNSRLIDTIYNSFSRVDIVESSFTRYAPGLSPSFSGILPEQIGVMIDAGSMNSITKHENLGFVDNLPSSIPYFLTDNKNTLIVNSGAGLDVLAALKNNASVTALETNPVVIGLLKDEYADYSGDIYNRADVVFGEGRSFLVKNKERFDIIVLSLAGGVLSSSSGISGLSENYLLTREAFEDYYNSLGEDGFLVVTRWLLFPPRESLRLFSLALEVDEEAKKIVMFRSWTTVTLVLSKRDLGEETIEEIIDFTEKNNFDIVYLPYDFVPNKNMRFEEPYYHNAVQNLLKDKDEFYKEYVFDVSSVTDDKPFYFNFFRISKIKELYSLAQNWNPFFDSGFLLFFVLVQALVLALVFVLLPIRFFKKTKINKSSLVFFFAIGLSYLFIEIVLIQKFVLFLGHIVFSSSTIIFSMLLFSSLGALYSQKVKNLNRIIFIIFILVVLYIFLTSFIINYFISLSLIYKIVLVVLFVAPLSFFMGIPFPTGIRIIKKELVPWAWAVNGSASVLSPILAVIIALFLGYNFVLFLAGIVYVLGSIFLMGR
ncbi:MAG: hypothetical protein ISS25_04250 [Nanoarchaeota archaeon]|nr:hypothetical protein [DPANN group archaeon]MBL7117013.1 hypothetical protein [Nanoarchaeota archaeon]